MSIERRKACSACVAIALAAGLAGCGASNAAKPAAKSAPASAVKKLPGEDELTSVTLTEGAIRGLGISTAKLVEKEVARTRTVGGDIVVPPGQVFVVSAPISGTLQAPKNGVPEVGSRVEAGRTIFELIPLLSPEAQATMATTAVEAQGQVDQAEKQLAQAKLLHERAERLRRDNLGGAGAVDDAKAQLEIATATLAAAKTRRDALTKTLRSLEGGTLEPVRIASDSGGILRNLHATPGEKVAAVAQLFEVITTDPMYVRVPVYVGDLDRIDETRPAQVGGLADAPGSPTVMATHVPAPPSADPVSACADLFYKIANPDGRLKPGQRVGVTLRLRDSRSALTAPKSAIVRDFDGGAWVYTVGGERMFVRKRVGVGAVVDNDAVLQFGPAAGTAVVAEGAAELFGIEFGGNK